MSQEVHRTILIFSGQVQGNPATYIDLLKTHRIHGTGIFSYIYHQNTIHASKYMPFLWMHMGNGWDKSTHISLNVYCNLAHPPKKKGKQLTGNKIREIPRTGLGSKAIYAFDLAWHMAFKRKWRFRLWKEKLIIQTSNRRTTDICWQDDKRFPTKSCCFTYAIGFNSFWGICCKHKM